VRSRAATAVDLARSGELAEQLGDPKGEVDTLSGVQPRVAHRLVAVVEVGVRQLIAAAETLGDVLAGELDVDAARPGAFGSVGPPLPVGSVGDLYIGGDGVSRGYLNQPDLTAERFRPNPFQTESVTFSPIIYNTGDRARYLADGRIVFLGREDHQVKIRGFRIELGDVEAAVARHPALAQNVTIAREDVPGDKRLVTYLIPEPGQIAPSAAEMREFLRRILPEYMIPAHFVVLDQFPLTPNNKINRLVLPPPGWTGDESGQDHRPPRTPLEAELVRHFMDVLHADAAGIDDSFFDLGGNSLLAAHLIAGVREAYQVNIPMRVFFQAPSAAGLARAIEAAQEAPAAENGRVAPLPRRGFRNRAMILNCWPDPT
jgi:acyl carrier protein